MLKDVFGSNIAYARVAESGNAPVLKFFQELISDAKQGNRFLREFWVQIPTLANYYSYSKIFFDSTLLSFLALQPTPLHPHDLLLHADSLEQSPPNQPQELTPEDAPE